MLEKAKPSAPKRSWLRSRSRGHPLSESNESPSLRPRREMLYDYGKNTASRTTVAENISSPPRIPSGRIGGRQARATARGDGPDQGFRSGTEGKGTGPKRQAALLSPRPASSIVMPTCWHYKATRKTGARRSPSSRPSRPLKRRRTVISSPPAAGSHEPKSRDRRQCGGSGRASGRQVDRHPESEKDSAAPFRQGQLFRRSRTVSLFKLIYPVPEQAGLGVHLTLDRPAKGVSVPMWSGSRDRLPGRSARAEKFYAAIRRYWPDLRDDSLAPAYSGVRPKLRAPGEPAADFVISGRKTTDSRVS